MMCEISTRSFKKQNGVFENMVYLQLHRDRFSCPDRMYLLQRKEWDFIFIFSCLIRVFSKFCVIERCSFHTHPLSHLSSPPLTGGIQLLSSQAPQIWIPSTDQQPHTQSPHLLFLCLHSLRLVIPTYSEENLVGFMNATA